MIEFHGDTIKLTKGDTAYIDLIIYCGDGSVYEPQTGDKIQFLLSSCPIKNKSQKFVLVKDIDINELEIIIDEQDTKFLRNKQYYYNVVLTTADGGVNTVSEGKFYIM